MPEQYILEMKNITKSFASNMVLDDINISVMPGEIRALIGENGAGKSTLMKILGGLYSADKGTVIINGEKTSIHSVEDAKKYGIGFIHQEINNVQSLSIAENMFLGREPRNVIGLVDYKKLYGESSKALVESGLNLDPHQLLSELSVAQQQLVEIARAINEKSRILIMDEPTAALTNLEVDHLFGEIRRLKENGVAIIYISHRMEETFAVCDTVSVLRDGKFIGTKKTCDTDEDELISMMVGREIDTIYGERHTKGKDILLEVRHLTTKKVKDINFTLKRGEILGFSGLVGAGRTEVALGLFGIDPILSGEIYIEGKKINIRKPADAIRSGIALVPEERKTQGLILNHSIGENLSFQVINSFIRRLKVDKKKEKQIIHEYKEKLSIKMSSVDQLASELSGGNQQKVVISKWLAAKPKILILDEPTRGIDVGAKAEIYKLMNELVNEGISIIMLSSEMPEVINNSSRIAVMSEGKLVTILDPEKDDISQENILSYAVTGGR